MATEQPEPGFQIPEQNGLPMIGSLIATIYLYSQRVFHSIQAGAQAIFEGFWLGLLPNSVTDIISQRSYKGGAAYTGSQYLDSGFQFWEEIAVQRFFPPGGRVLVASAGGGREIIALTRAGYTADGFECCNPMVLAGNRALSERGMTGRIQWAPPSRIPELPGMYDAAIIGWNGYTYISPPERRVAFMKSLLPHLRQGSPVLVSGAFRTMRSGSAVWTPRIANLIRVLTLRAPVFTAGAGFPGRPRQRFTRQQLEAELNDAGFSPAGFWKWGDFGAVVCRKGAVATSNADKLSFTLAEPQSAAPADR